MFENKLPPHDLEAEKAVLGSILIDSDAFLNCDLMPDDFYAEQNKWIFQAILNLYNGGSGINQITVAHELSRVQKLDDSGGSAYLSNLIYNTPTSLHAEYYSKIVKKCADNRRLISAAHKIAAIGYKNDDSQSGLMDAQSILLKAGTVKDELFTFDELAREAVGHYGRLRHNYPGILTGLVKYDELLGGVLPGEYLILAANTSVGKTSLATQISRYIAQTKQVLIVSLEMTRQAIIDKNVAALSGVPSKLINLGNYPPDREERILNATAQLSTLNGTVTTTANTTMKIRNTIERMKLGKGVDFVVIDYIQKIRDRYGKSENDRISFISSELANMAKDYNVAIMALSQLNRLNWGRQDKRPMMSDLRDSGSLEQDADTILMLYRESYISAQTGEKSKDSTTELIVRKNRLRGNLGTICLDWNAYNERYIG